MLAAVTSDSARAAASPWGAVVGAIVGTVFFAWIAGPQVLDPRSIDWVMKGDWVPHYFGWHYFRVEPWHWPPGAIHGYYAPLGSSVGLTDSIPLVAYALKPVARWLPTPFQYLGPFLLVSFALQGALGARLIGRWIRSPLTQVLGATLFVLLPTLLVRVGHTALCAHWLVLWALLIATRPDATRFATAGWAALGLTAGMVQPYLAAMVLGVLGATAVARGAAPVTRRAVALGAALAATLAGWWLSGLFLLRSDGSLAAGGLGFYSMNLLAFISPSGWSRFVPDLPVATDGQIYEGFQYLGLGILMLMATALVVRVVRRGAITGAGEARVWSPWLVVACLAMTAFAVSPVVTLGAHTVAHLDGAWTAPLALFRSSGRFAWPLVYVLLTAAIVTVSRYLSARSAATVLAAAVALQVIDLHDAHAFRRQAAHDPAFHSWTNPFADARWQAVAPAYRHLALVPPPQCGLSPVPYEGAIALAAAHGLTLNAGVVARRDEAARIAYCGGLEGDVAAARLADDTLYVVSAATAAQLTSAASERVSCGAIGGVWLCTTTAARARWIGAPKFD